MPCLLWAVGTLLGVIMAALLIDRLPRPPLPQSQHLPLSSPPDELWP